MTDRTAARQADALAYVCAHLPELRVELREGYEGSEAPLTRVVAAAREGGDVGRALEGLHAAIQRDGDALGLFGYVDEAFTRGPVAAGTSRVPVGTPADTVYVCPDGRCTRYWLPQGTDSVPGCVIGERPLRRERL
ncbi:hypothetical protein ACWG5P_21960 [Streptomyces prasinus]|uniref:hypothetical protein n=1 Tax=Streptomyces prasinus TaxID=67345 RepID=UPI0033A00601